MRYRSPANRPASSPPVPARTSTITSLSSFGSGSTMASRISSSSSPRRSSEVRSSSRNSGSSPSSFRISRAPAASSAAFRYSAASTCAGSSAWYARPTSAYRARSPITSGSVICFERSSKRSSICSTSRSIMRSRLGALGDDLHADSLLVRRLVGVFDREDRLERDDRNLELREIRLARGELLELHSGRHEDLRPSLVALLAEQLDELEREPGDQRDPDDSRREEDVPRRRPERGEHDDRDDHDDQEEAGSAARMKAGEALGVLGGERQPRLVTGDCLVLGPVVLEHPLELAHPRDEPEVPEEDADPDQLLDEYEDQRRVQLRLEQARDPHRDKEEQANCEHNRHRDRAGPGSASDLLVLCTGLSAGRDAERPEPDLQRLDGSDDTTNDRQTQEPVAADPGDEWLGDHLDLAARHLAALHDAALGDLIGRRLSYRDGP